MKYIQLIEGWRSEKYKLDVPMYEKELGVNIFDMLNDAIEDDGNKKWLLDKLIEYKKNLENHNFKTIKDLLYDKAKAILNVSISYDRDMNNLNSLDDLLKTYKGKYEKILMDEDSVLIYQNTKWTIFTTNDYGKGKYIPYRERRTSYSTYYVYPFKELEYDIDKYPFQADKHTFIFIINNVDIKKSLLLRANWKNDYVLLEFDYNINNDIITTSNLEDIYKPLKKRIKVGSLVRKVLDWVEENTEFPVWDDVGMAQNELYERLKEDEFQYLYYHFNQEQFLNLFQYNYSGCLVAFNNILLNFSKFKFKNKYLYDITKEYINFNDLFIEDSVKNFLSNIVNSEVINKDLKLNLKFDSKESENDRYDKIFKYINEDKYENLINKYSSTREFTEELIQKVEVSNKKNVDHYFLDDLLTYLWGPEWFKSMIDQEFEIETDRWKTTTNSLIIVFNDAVDISEMADQMTNITSGILTKKKILNLAEQYLEDYWNQISV